MAYVDVEVRSASNLTNVKGSRPQSPFLVGFIKYLSMEYADAVVNPPHWKGGVTVRDWNLKMRFLCERRRLGRAVLALHLFHRGKTTDKRIGIVEIPLYNLAEERGMICQVRNPSGVFQGELDVLVRVAKRRPVQREIEVSIPRAVGLKNVKSIWRRFSFQKGPFLRKMSPYVVAWINTSRVVVFPTAIHGGKNPVWQSKKVIYTVDDSLLADTDYESSSTLTFHLYHRHKAEIRRSNLSVEPTIDLLIGVAKIPLSKSTRSLLTCDVYTKGGKAEGTLFVSVGIGEPPKEESATPTRPSWEPRTNTACFGFDRTAPWFNAVGATATIVSTVLGVAAFI